MAKNAIVGQSGGPTSVINASLAGVYESCKRRGAGKPLDELGGRTVALYLRTHAYELHKRVSAAQRALHIVDNGAGKRRHHGNTRAKRGDAPLARVDGQFWREERACSARLNLDYNQLVGVNGHYVKVAVPVAPVPPQYAEALALQVFGGQPLAPLPLVVVFGHCFSFLGVKEVIGVTARFAG